MTFKTLNRCLALFFLSLITACSPDIDDASVSAFKDAASDPSRFQSLLEERADALDVSSVAFYRSVNGETDREHFIGERVDEDSLFQAASMSKAVAAAGILTFALDRDISPDDDIRPYVNSLDWKDIPGGDEPVTLRALLSHTAGANVHGFLGYAQGKDLPTNLEVVKGTGPANSSRVVLKGTKGEFSYSGGGYQMAQLFAEEVSGEPFPVLMKRLVLDPLGMTRSRFEVNIDADAIAPLKVAAADAGAFPIEGPPRAVRGSWHNYPEAAAAGLWTTPRDYAKFANALLSVAKGQTDDGLSTEVAALMLTAVDANYGLGVSVYNADQPERFAFGHSGSNRGYKCKFEVDVSDGEVVVIMGNAPYASVLNEEVILALVRD
ncbi:MAG: serine hydrolase domain-containing protein [Pseudomonadota bacterium]